MFDWKLYQDDQLIEEYLSLKTKDNNYKVNNNLYYNDQKKQVVKQSDEYSFIINLIDKTISVKLNSHNYEGNISLYKSTIKETKKTITIVYQISEEEPLYKIVITRRNI